MINAAPRSRVLAGFLVIYTVWGSTYLAIRIGIETIPPFLLGGVRFVIAGLLLMGWARIRGAPKPTLREWRSAAIVGVLLLSVGNGAVSWSEQRVSSGLAALFVATVPLWLVVGEWFEGRAPGMLRLAGVACGLAGVGYLMWPMGDGGGVAVDVWGALALTGGALSWAMGSLYARRAPMTKAPFLSIGMQMLAGGVVMLLVAAAHGDMVQATMTRVSSASLWALLYLVVFGSLVGFSTYMWLVRVASPTAVGTYAYVNPPVAVLLGALFAGETLPPQAAIAMTVIIGSVILVSIASRQARTTGATSPGVAAKPTP